MGQPCVKLKGFCIFRHPGLQFFCLAGLLDSVSIEHCQRFSVKHLVSVQCEACSGCAVCTVLFEADSVCEVCSVKCAVCSSEVV